MEQIDQIFGEYFRFVFAWDENDNGRKWCEMTDDPEFAEYLEIYFNNSAMNMDFVEWYEGTGDYAENGHYKCGRKGAVSDILDFQSCCEVIRIIEQYSDFEMDYANITPEILMSNYLDVYLGRLTADDLRDILRV